MSTFDQLIDHLMEGWFFLQEAVEILEKGMIERAMSKTEQNQSLASKALGIHRNTLQRKMLAYGIDGKRPRRKAVARVVAARVVGKKKSGKQLAS